MHAYNTVILDHEESEGWGSCKAVLSVEYLLKAGRENRRKVKGDKRNGVNKKKQIEITVPLIVHETLKYIYIYICTNLLVLYQSMSYCFT